MVALSNNSFSNKKSLLRPKVHSLGIYNNEPTKHLLEPLTRYIQCKYSAGVKFIFAIQMKKGNIQTLMEYHLILRAYLRIFY